MEPMISVPRAQVTVDFTLGGGQRGPSYAGDAQRSLSWCKAETLDAVVSNKRMLATAIKDNTHRLVMSTIVLYINNGGSEDNLTGDRRCPKC